MIGKGIDSYVEIALIFVLGILAGVALKVEAGKMITIGFDDYKMKFSSNQYSINDLQKKINETLAAQEKENSAQSEKNVEQEDQK
jgi:ribosomal protein L11 methylase PrmA